MYNAIKNLWKKFQIDNGSNLNENEKSFILRLGSSTQTFASNSSEAIDKG